MKFSSILIANRGEIACRIIDTCSQMGIESIAVYSYADRHALHVQKASKAFYIGESESSRSYLNVAAIIEACRKSKAQAVHPGYGFLSENGHFARELEKAGVVFIGPKPEVIELLGDKVASKDLAKRCKVACVPGVEFAANTKPDQALDLIKNLAKQVNYPLIVKAAGGGGGRGMRRIDSDKDIETALQSAAREAQAFFNNASVFVEKMVVGGRHIEVQIVGDLHGEVRHIYDRDCTFQRNHQKVIEEAPAPALDPKTRANIWRDALEICKQANYSSLGTVEFLLAPDGKYYFLEVNSRLQVEHPVTEAISGLDLVRLQIECAQGEKLSKNLTLNGDQLPQLSAIECRLCAEDPSRNFSPSSGQILEFRNESFVPGLRIDTGVRSGDSITHYYDSLIAKLVVCADSRTEAIRKMQQAVRDTTIYGVQSNLELLDELLSSQDFFNISHSTSSATLIAEKLNAHAINPQIAGALVLLWQVTKFRHPGFRISDRSALRAVYDIGTEQHDIILEPQNGTLFLLRSSKTLESISVISRSCDQITLRIGEKDYHANLRQYGESFWIGIGAQQLEVRKSAIRLRGSRSGGVHQAMHVISPLPGKVVSIKAKVGEQVLQGAEVATIESMKMEHIIRSPRDAIIKVVHVKNGQTIESKTVLVDLDAVS